MSLGSYLYFIGTAYLATALVVALLIAWTAIDYHYQRRSLRELQERGVARRSERSAMEMK